MPKLSIIIPVYNVEKYLRECLDSVVAQTFTDWECICVDDGSTDSSPSILEDYAAKDSRFRIIHREHSNAGASRNAGMDIATGDFYSFLDSDDIFAPRMLEFLIRESEKHDAEIVSCLMITYQDGDKTPQLSHFYWNSDIVCYINPALTEDIFSKWSGRAWDKLFRRSFVTANALRFQEIRSSNDTLFTYSAITLAKKVINIKCPLIAHRRNSGSLEATRSKDPKCIIDAVKSYYDNMQLQGVFKKSPSLEHHFRIWVVKNMFWYMDTIDTADAYQIVHEAFFDISRFYDLNMLSQDDFSFKPEMFKRFQRVLLGCPPLESSHLHELMLAKEVANLQPLMKFADSKDYKLGRMLLFLPRMIKWFLTSVSEQILLFLERLKYQK